MFRLLLIADEEGVAGEVAAHLAGMTTDIIAVARVSEAIDAVQRQPFDAALFYWTPTHGDFAELLSPLRAAEVTLPIIVLSGSPDEFWMFPALEAGAQDFLLHSRLTANVLQRVLFKAAARARTAERTQRIIAPDSARSSAEESERRAHFLALASQVLVSSLETETTLQAVANLATEHIAALCLIERLDGNGVQIVAMAGAELGKNERLQLHGGMRERCALPHPRAKAAKGEASLIRNGSADILAAGVAEDEERLLRAIAPESCVIVPLQARGEVRGTMTLARTAREAPFSRADLELAEDLAGRMALALDNARLYREAQAAAHVRDEVIAVVSHDLRNPLTVVSVTAYNLRNALKDGPPELLTQVDKIDRSAMRMSRLIEDLLDITRLESGALPLERQPHSIRELLHEVHELHSTLAEEKSIRFEYSDVAHHWLIDADRHRALQILSNLVGNAIKFTPREGRVRVLTREEPAQFVFSVEDTGPGIKQHQVAHLFNRFWQANRRDRKGTGLGLTIARGLVEAHGGRIWVETKEGAGSTFSFSLPAVRPEASAAAGSTAAPDSEAPPDQPACG